LFSVSSCYNWLDFGAVISKRFHNTWSVTIPLKIKNFLWLISKNKILTKDNLRKRGWIGDSKCVFCQEDETINHLFLHCSNACLWSWLSNYNNFNFCISSIEELWTIDYSIPFKDSNLCEIIRGAFLWVIWKERNKIIFQQSNCSSIRSLGSSIIAFARY
jgi:zinc-binding in reverse transcriptase